MLRTPKHFIAIILALFVVLSVLVSIGPTRADDPLPKIETPYAAGAMPAADEILEHTRQQFAAAERWSADVTLTTFVASPRRFDEYTGTIHVDEDSYSADLQSTNNKTSNLHLRIHRAGDSAAAWLENRPPGGKPSNPDNAVAESTLQRLAPVLEFLDVWDASENSAASDLLSRYRWINEGKAKYESREYFSLMAAYDDNADTIPVAGVDAHHLVIHIDEKTQLPRRITVAAHENTDNRFVDVGMKNLRFNDNALPPAANPTPPDDALVINLSAEPAESDTPENPVPYDDESIARGRRLYLADCVVCHSRDGTGRDSDVTDNAADLTDTEYWLSDGSPYDTFLAIRDGAGEEMPGYKDDYRDEKMIWDLVNFIRHLQEEK